MSTAPLCKDAFFYLRQVYPRCCHQISICWFFLFLPSPFSATGKIKENTTHGPDLTVTRCPKALKVLLIFLGLHIANFIIWNEKAIMGNNPRAVPELKVPITSLSQPPWKWMTSLRNGACQKMGPSAPLPWGSPMPITHLSFFLEAVSTQCIGKLPLGESSNADEPWSSSSSFHLQSLVPIEQGHLGRWGSHRAVSQLCRAGICNHSPHYVLF